MLAAMQPARGFQKPVSQLSGEEMFSEKKDHRFSHPKTHLSTLLQKVVVLCFRILLDFPSVGSTMFGAKKRRAIAWTIPGHDARLGGDEAGGRYGNLNLEIGLHDHQAQCQKYKARGCGVLDPVRTMHASLQVSRAIAYQGISPVKIGGCTASEGTRARAGPLIDAGRDAMSVMESNNASLQFPGIGNSGKNTSMHPSIGRWKPNVNRSPMPLHPSDGRFKTDGVNFFDFGCAGCPGLESRTVSKNKPVARHQKCRGSALAGAVSPAVAKTSTSEIGVAPGEEMKTSHSLPQQFRITRGLYRRNTQD